MFVDDVKISDIGLGLLVLDGELARLKSDEEYLLAKIKASQIKLADTLTRMHVVKEAMISLRRVK